MHIFKLAQALIIRTAADQASKSLRKAPWKRSRKDRFIINLWHRI